MDPFVQSPGQPTDTLYTGMADLRRGESRRPTAGVRSGDGTQGKALAHPPAPVPALPVDRVEALVPPQLLYNDEIVILLIKPSLWFIPLSCRGMLASIALVGGLVAWTQSVFTFMGIGVQSIIMITLGLMLLRLFWQFFEWLGRIYVLTDCRVIRIRGVLSVSVYEARLTQLQYTKVHMSMVERLFRLGTIAFSTAGADGPEACWSMIRHPLRVHQEVVRAIRRCR